MGRKEGLANAYSNLGNISALAKGLELAKALGVMKRTSRTPFAASSATCRATDAAERWRIRRPRW